jgi:hypothetical protein
VLVIIAPPFGVLRRNDLKHQNFQIGLIEEKGRLLAPLFSYKGVSF